MRRGRAQFGNKPVAADPPESVVIAFFAEHSTPLLVITISMASIDRAEHKPSVKASPSMSLIENLPRIRKVRLPRADGLTQWMVPLAIIVVWQAACVTGFVSLRVLPAPSDVVMAGWKLLLSGDLARNIWVSFWRAGIGFFIGGSIGFAFGLANGLSQLSNRLTDTTLQMVRNIPHLALIPLVILWFGIDESAKLFLVALGVFFPIYLNTLHGVRTVDPQLIEMGRIYGMNDGELFRRVIFPGALPSIFVGVRFALGIMWLTLIVAETIAASSGLGYMAMQAREFMQIDVVVLSILIYALLGKLADSASRGLERLTLSWHPAFQKH
jgi:sulfonate transport system permease protein